MKNMQHKLQNAYDDCNWQGYCMLDGVKLYRMDIQKLAKEAGIELSYNCPA